MQYYMINTKQILDNKVLLEKEDLHHIFNVMRMTTGHNIICCDYETKLKYRCLINVDGITIEEILDENNELGNDLILVYSLVKSDKLELVIQKASEIGATKLILLNTRRSIIKLDPKKSSKKIERYNKIVKEACEQCRRNTLMEVVGPVSIKDLKNHLCDINLVAYEALNNNNDNLINYPINKQSCMIVIGPEGGFEQTEIDDMNKLGINAVSLGKRILRSETACIYSLSIIAYLMEKGGN